MKLRFIYWPALEKIDLKISLALSAYDEMINKGNKHVNTIRHALITNSTFAESDGCNFLTNPDNFHDEFMIEAFTIENFENLYWKNLLSSQIHLLHFTLRYFQKIADRKLNMNTEGIVLEGLSISSYHNHLTKIFSISGKRMETNWAKIELAIKIVNLIESNDSFAIRENTYLLNQNKSIIIKVKDGNKLWLAITDGRYSQEISKLLKIYFKDLLDAIDSEYKKQCGVKNLKYF